MMNKLTKKIAYILCMSSIMSLTTVESMQKDKNKQNDEKQLVIRQNNNNNNETTNQNREIENGILGADGINRDIFLMLCGISLRMQLPNMFGISGESVSWMNHNFYYVYRNNKNAQEIRVRRLCRLLTNWEDVPLEANITEDSRMACNGQTIAVAGSKGIFCSIDGRTYEKIDDSCIEDIIAADGEYVATGFDFSDDLDSMDYISKILTIDNKMKLNEYHSKRTMLKLAYNEVNKTYHGIYERRGRRNICINNDITKFALCNGDRIDNTSYFSSFYICSGNGMVVMSEICTWKSYYIDNGLLKKTDLSEDILDMSYNKKSKRIMAVTRSYYSMLWEVYSTENGRQWEKELNVKDDFGIVCDVTKSFAPVLTTIDDYSVLLIRPNTPLPIVHILIRKNDGKWIKISGIRGIGEYCKIKQVIETNSGIFMLTNRGMKKAVGNIMPTIVESTPKPEPMPAPMPAPEPEHVDYEDNLDDDTDFANEPVPRPMHTPSPTHFFGFSEYLLTPGITPSHTHSFESLPPPPPAAPVANPEAAPVVDDVPLPAPMPVANPETAPEMDVVPAPMPVVNPEVPAIAAPEANHEVPAPMPEVNPEAPVVAVPDASPETENSQEDRSN